MQGIRRITNVKNLLNDKYTYIYLNCSFYASIGSPENKQYVSYCLFSALSLSCLELTESRRGHNFAFIFVLSLISPRPRGKGFCKKTQKGVFEADKIKKKYSF